MKSCSLHTIFISLNVLLSVVFSIISILPRVREYNSSCGLLQSSFVSFYVTYLTWSAMSSNPQERCNPNLRLFAYPHNTTASRDSSASRQQNLSDPITLVGLVLFVGTLFYSVISSSRNNRARKFFLSSSFIDSTILDDAQLVNSVSDNKWLLNSDEQLRQRVYDDERGSVTYNYSFLHLMFASASLYAMMTLTK